MGLYQIGRGNFQLGVETECATCFYARFHTLFLAALCILDQFFIVGLIECPLLLCMLFKVLFVVE